MIAYPTTERLLGARKLEIQPIDGSGSIQRDNGFARCQAKLDGLGDGVACYLFDPDYPGPGVSNDSVRSVIVIDTLSMALAGQDEKGPGAGDFIHDCLDLLKPRPDLAIGEDDDSDASSLSWPVAAHIIVIHHQTKSGLEFAEHRAIGANTQGLYRVHRFGKLTDANRPFAGQITQIRVKGIPRLAPLRFEVEVVPVEGTKQTAALLKDKAPEIPHDLLPVIKVLREFETGAEILAKDLNECLDAVVGGKEGAAKRKARQRARERLEAAGVPEPVMDDGDSVRFNRLQDSGAAG